MATNRIVLLITDEEIDILQSTIETLDTHAENFRDDWREDEEPLREYLAEIECLVNLRDKIKTEVLAS